MRVISYAHVDICDTWGKQTESFKSWSHGHAVVESRSQLSSPCLAHKVAAMPLSDLWSSDDACEQESAHGQSLLEKLTRSNRTSKARAANLLAQQKKKLQRTSMASAYYSVDAEADAKTVFQQKFLASPVTQWDPFEDMGNAKLTHDFAHEANGRRRAVFSYFKNFAASVKTLFQWGSEKPEISHVITVNTNDDTNMKLGSGTRGSAEIRSVMNNIQEHVVFQDSKSEPTWFHVHQPIVALDRADTFGLYTAFLAWVLGFASYVGWRLRSWGIPHELFRGVYRHTFVYLGDALKVNDALFEYLAQTAHDQADNAGTMSCALQVHCNIHQLSLTRRYVALGSPGYFSNLVRLGHLFEGHAFRQKLKATMSKIIQENFQYVRVAELPPEVSQHKEFTVRELRLHTDSCHTGLGGSLPGRRQQKRMSVRLKLLLKLTEKDNGNPLDDSFVHFCLGESCCPGGEQEALSTIVSIYLDLFSNMSVPLLYRWKHAGAANCFVRDGNFLHRILPRALAAMPSFKGVLPVITGITGKGLLRKTGVKHLR